MNMRRKSLSVSALAFSILFATSSNSQQTLDADNFRRAAVIALESGQSEKAKSFALALLKRDETDFTARLIHARALRDLGEYREAVKSARIATKLADNKAQKYTSSLILAQTLSSNGNKTRAQLWLRRAVQYAPHPKLAERAARDFQYVQRTNPWRTDFEFTLAPNSNINNGSARETSQLNFRETEALQALLGGPIEFELPVSSQAISGVEYGIGINTRYRFKETSRTAQDLTFAVNYRSFVLSDSAQSSASDLSGSDFSFGVLQLGYNHKRLTSNGKGEFSYNVNLGQSWYGGARLARFAGLGASYNQTIKGGKKLRYSTFLNLQSGFRTFDQQTLTLSTDYITQFSNGGQLVLSGQVSASQSTTSSAEYTQLQIGVDYALPKPVFGANLQFGVGARFRDHDFSQHDASGRQDTEFFANADAVMSKIEYYGFNPTISVKAATTNSNIGLFDTRRFSVGLGVRSSF